MKNVAVVGLGYFSQFHLAAWAKQPGIRLVAVADTDAVLADEIAAEYGVSGYADVDELVQESAPDIIDLVVPPSAHAGLIRGLLKPGLVVICQKPFCTSLAEAEAIVAEAEAANTALIIHENFRFQPWYREIKSFLDSGRMGRVYSARFALRPGDGRGADAYLARQPSFQKMQRFLVQETAVHLLDVFRWLFGPVSHIYADLRQLNPVIAGEDAGQMILSHETGVQTVFDGNRLADHVAENTRKTMGEMVIEGEGGTLSLNGDGALFFREFGRQDAVPVTVSEPVDDTQFGGGCVAALIAHVVDGSPLENTGRDYLEVIRLCEAAYRSDAEGRRIGLRD